MVCLATASHSARRDRSSAASAASFGSSFGLVGSLGWSSTCTGSGFAAASVFSTSFLGFLPFAASAFEAASSASLSFLISSSSILIRFSRAATFALCALSCSSRSLSTSAWDRPLMTGSGGGSTFSFGLSVCCEGGLEVWVLVMVCASGGGASFNSIYFCFHRSAAARAASSCLFSCSFSSFNRSTMSWSFSNSSSRSTSSPKFRPLWGLRPKGSLPFLYLEGSRDRMRRTFSVITSIIRSLRSSSNWFSGSQISLSISSNCFWSAMISKVSSP
mmetsp:Transcript_50622/g.120768  ORF Transcript_50622/g.120768 Transcript_50622/m.120768 type:complete len:274 (+) Transcript_50622:1282-2103(+)